MSRSPNVSIHLWKHHLGDIGIEEKDWSPGEYIINLGSSFGIFLQEKGMLDAVMKKLISEYDRVKSVKIDSETKKGGLSHEKDS